MDANEREFSMSQKDAPVGMRAVHFNHEFHEFSEGLAALESWSGAKLLRSTRTRAAQVVDSEVIHDYRLAEPLNH
jgi:hypothetical protein